MGSTVSSPISTMQWLVSESTRILNIVATIVSITSEMVMNYITDLDDRAELQVGIVFRDIEDFLTELSGYGTQAQFCISQKRSELQKARDELIQKLITCYKAQQKAFERLKIERVALHDEAIKLKQDAETNLANCTRQNDTNFRELNKNLTRLSRRVNILVKKAEIHLKREFTERRKNIVQMISCDRKAVDQAYETIQDIVKDIRICMFSETQNRENFYRAK